MDENDSITKEALDSLVRDGILEIVGRNEHGEVLYGVTEFGRLYGDVILRAEKSATFKS
jgi:hypothetical protein